MLKKNKNDCLLHLLRGVSNGDTLAFNSLYDKYKKTICIAAESATGNKDIAEDVFQEVMIKLYRINHRLLPVKSPGGWLVQMTKNQAISMIRKEKYSKDIKNFENVIQINDFSSEVIVDILVEDLSTKLEKTTKKIFKLKQTGLTHKEIAQRLNMKEATVRWKYSTVIKKLKNLWEKTRV